MKIINGLHETIVIQYQSLAYKMKEKLCCVIELYYLLIFNLFKFKVADLGFSNLVVWAGLRNIIHKYNYIL